MICKMRLYSDLLAEVDFDLKRSSASSENDWIIDTIRSRRSRTRMRWKRFLDDIFLRWTTRPKKAECSLS